MALRSMTGYGRGQATADGLRVTVELSSVNRRQLDLHINLPRSLSILEARIAEDVHQAVHRGRITGEVNVAESSQLRRKSIRVDEDLAEAYLDALRATARKFKLEDDFSGTLLLQLPDVVHYEQIEEDVDRIWPVLQKALLKALRELVRMRNREGKALQQDLEARLGRLGELVEEIRGEAPKVTGRYRTALRERVARAGVEMPVDDDRLLREIVLFADRSDIAEELTRLESHMKQARKLMRSREATGKSLDFLAQEMFREINTIASKGNDSAIVRRVVTFKAELERFREQVQNIE
jgi:uncharacterized protein (TIGR00255 family)